MACGEISETRCTLCPPTRPGLAWLAEHREPDFIAEAYLKDPVISIA